MNVSSLTLAFVQYGSTAELARTRSMAALAQAAAVQASTAPAATEDAGSHREPCDGPRRSPLYRALMDALGSLAQSAPPAAAPTAASAATATAATAGVAPTSTTTAATAATADAAPAAGAAAPAADAPAKLEDAVMNFARALMQALRGADPGGEGQRTHGHHHHEHHDNGRRAWGDPAQRIDQLAAQVGATPAAAQGAGAVPAATSSTTGTAGATPPAADAAVPAPTDASTAATSATPAAPAVLTAGAPTSVIYVQIQLNGATAPAAPPGRAQQGLIDAFGSLQKALGLPATDGAAGLQSQLSAFLNALAEKLRGSDANTASATTQPGALLNVSA